MKKEDPPMNKDVPCAFCGASIVGRLFVVCGRCDVPMHHDCWAVSGSCPAYGCGSNESLDPALVIYRRPAAPATALVPVGAAAAVAAGALFGVDPEDPARVRARMKRLDTMVESLERSLAPHNRRFVAAMLTGIALMVGGITFHAPAVIFASIFALAGGSLFIVIGTADPARRLMAARSEHTRLEILLLPDDAGGAATGAERP